MGSAPKTIVIGAGIAGAATAWWLARRGAGDLVLLEREPLPGTHSTGRNAAILRTAIREPSVRAMALESASFLRKPPSGFAPGPLIDPTGLYLLADSARAPGLDDWLVDCAASGMELEPVDASRALSAAPQLGWHPATAWWAPDEGILDVHAILEGYLRGARAGGAQLELGRVVTSILAEGGRVRGVDTDRGPIHGDAVVIATGGWAARTGETIGCVAPLIPHRRHIAVTAPITGLNPRQPIVWIDGRDFYFRPESAGLLMSACDQVPVDPDLGTIEDESAIEQIAERASLYLPSIADTPLTHHWAGLRTLTPDAHFFLGPDQQWDGLHWAAGVGGHGITCSAAVGRLVADQILDGPSNDPIAVANRTGRFLVHS